VIGSLLCFFVLSRGECSLEGSVIPLLALVESFGSQT